jgi:hypothetical protein
MAETLNHLIISDLDFHRYTGWEPKRLKRLIEWSEIYGKRSKPFLKVFAYPILLSGKWLISSIIFAIALIIISSFLMLLLEYIRYFEGAYYSNPYIQDFWSYLSHLPWESSIFVVYPLAITLSFYLGIILGFIQQVRYFMGRLREEKALESLIYLMEEVEKYNELLQDLRVKIRIAEIRKDLDKSNLIPIEQIFTAMQNQLVQALQIERVVRENRSIVKSGLNVLMEDATFLRSVEIFSEIQDFDPLLNLVLDIEFNVRKEVLRIMPV